MTKNSNSCDVNFTDMFTGKGLNPGQMATDNHPRDIRTKHPMDPEDLPKQAHLQKALRDANRYGRNWTDKQKEDHFDEVILEFADEALEEIGIFDNGDLEFAEYLLTKSRVRAFLLIRARETNINIFCDRYSDFYEELGLDGHLSQSSLYRCWSHMRDDEELLSALSLAVSITLYAYYRTGGPIPDSVRDAHINHKPSYSPIAREETGFYYALSDSERGEAIRNWCELLVEACVDPISFGRESNVSYNKYSFIGSLAHAALESRAVNNCERTLSPWIVNSTLVSSGDNILTHIKKLDINSISRMFIEANQAFFSVADQHVNLPEYVRIAYDPTDILWENDGGDDVEVDDWLKGHASSYKGDAPQTNADWKWVFGVVSIINSSHQYCLGVYPIGKDVGDGDAIERLVREVYHNYPFWIDQLVMDRGMVSADVVDHTRSVVEDDWLLLGKRQYAPKELIQETSEGEINFHENIDHLKDLTECPNAIVVPIKEETETENTQRVFLTDLDEDDIEPSTLNYQYRRRRRIESSIGTSKDLMPDTRSSKTEVRYFLLSVGMLFHNFTKLMNEALSPEHALPLNASPHDRVTTNEVLSGIRHICFKRAAEKTDTSYQSGTL